MDNEKIGKFIKSLREEKKMSQYDLAELIPITREAVSRWERGKSCPDKSCLLKLTEIFDVTVDELLYGERKNKQNEELIEQVPLTILNENKKIKKLFRISIFVLICLIITFFIYYFFITYNTIKIYTISGENNEFNINDGVFIVTKDKIYFNLGKIETDKEISHVKIYSLINNNEKLVFESDNQHIVLHDFYGYQAYFDYNNFENIINDMYAEITTNDETITIKLDFENYFFNNKIYNKKVKKISSGNVNNNFFKSKIDLNLIKKKFIKSSDGYIYSDKKNGLDYFFIEDLLQVSIINNNKNEYVYIQLSSFYFYYQKYSDNKVVNDFQYNGNKVNCNIGKCDNYLEIADYYLDNFFTLIENSGNQ